MINKKYALVILVMFLFSVHEAEANIITQQNTNFATSMYSIGLTQGTQLTQTLGTGLSGTLGNIQVYIQSRYTANSNNIATIGILVECFTTSAYGVNANCGSISQSSGPIMNDNSSLIRTLTYTPTFTFNPAYYYRIKYSTGNHVQSGYPLIYGSNNSSSYANGVCAGWNYSGACGSMADLYFVINDTTPSSPSSGDYTQFTNIVPAGGAIVSTTSLVTVGFTAWVTPQDVGKQVNLQIFPKNSVFGAGSLFGWVGGDFSNYGSWDIVATSSGYMSFSTTTPIKLLAGSYSANAKFRSACITVPLFGTTCLSDLQDSRGLFVASTTNFVAGYASQLGNEIDNVTSIINNSLYSQNSTTTPIIENCNLNFGFSATKCLGALFIPSSDQIKSTFNGLYNGFLLYAPWGYVTRVGGILTGYQSVATSSLLSSNLAITFSSGSNPLYNASSTQIFKGKTITFINWSSMASSTTNNYWGSGWILLNSFLSMVFGAGFIFWFWKFASRHFRP